MGSAIRHANAAIELDTVHRFRDPNSGALTLRLRDAVVASERWRLRELVKRGHVDRVEHQTRHVIG